MSILCKKDLYHLCELALVDIKKEKEEKILSDLEKILHYFSQIKEVNTENLQPSFNGHFEQIVNQFREKEQKLEIEEKGFPFQQNGYVKGPRIMNNE